MGSWQKFKLLHYNCMNNDFYWLFKNMKQHQICFLPLSQIFYSHTCTTDSWGLAEPSTVAVESRRAGPAGGKVLISYSIAPGSYGAGMLLRELGPPWTNIACRTDTARGCSHLWESWSNHQNTTKLDHFHFLLKLKLWAVWVGSCHSFPTHYQQLIQKTLMKSKSYSFN